MNTPRIDDFFVSVLVTSCKNRNGLIGVGYRIDDEKLRSRLLPASFKYYFLTHIISLCATESLYIRKQSCFIRALGIYAQYIARRRFINVGLIVRPLTLFLKVHITKCRRLQYVHNNLCTSTCTSTYRVVV